MMGQSFHVFAMSLCLVVVTACQEKGPAPKVGTTETSGAHPGAAQDPHAGMAATGDPHAGMATTQDPHAGMDPRQVPGGAAPTSGQPDASGMIDLGAAAFKMPAKWSAQTPRSAMRRAQLSAPGSAGAAELIVYFFGPQGAGTAQENLDRWVGQFSNPDGSAVTDAKQTSSKVSGMDVTRLEVAGQYAGGMNAAGQQQPGQENQRMIAAIVSSQGGPYYFKFVGPSATVSENAAAFDALIASLVPSP